jgi:hypothetical protein
MVLVPYSGPEGPSVSRALKRDPFSRRIVFVLYNRPVCLEGVEEGL